MKIDKSIAGWAVAALLILCAFAAVVLMLTPELERGRLITTAAGPIGGLLGAVAAAVAARYAHVTRKETSAQTPVLQQIKHQTNGSLDERFAESERRIVTQVGLMLEGGRPE